MLTATVTWLDPVYEAALDGEAEWPPHPGRLFCALVSASRGEGDDEALRWLERQPPPEVHAPASWTASEGQTAYVPTNQVSETKSNRVARVSGARTWYRTLLCRPTASFCWSGEPEDHVLRGLDRLARRVPFLGRSTSQCMVSFTKEPPADTPETTRFLPSPRGRQRLRIAYRGHLDALRDAYDASDPARTADRWAFYESARQEGGLTADTGRVGDREALGRPDRQGAYEDLLVRAFPAGVHLDGRQVLRVATAFKAALLSRLGRGHGRDELALLHGHHDGTRRQCAFLALPFVGNAHATGGILGVGLAVSREVPAPVLRSLIAFLDEREGGLDELEVPGLARVPLGQPDGRMTLRPERWTRPSRTWASVLPVALDRYPDDAAELEAVVRLGCRFAGYPEPVEVEVLTSSVVAGACRLRGADLRRRRDPPSPAVHVRLSFSEAVPGPVVLGRLRHLGLGLCASQTEGSR